MGNMFRVGHLTYLPEHDVEFNIFKDAVDFAASMLEKQRPLSNEPFGIWRGERDGSGIVAIYYDGALFKPTNRDRAETKPLR